MDSYTHEIAGGAAWSLRLRAGRTATFTALGANANLSTLIYGADLLDRLNLPDTLKAQMSARITAPMVLMSDRGLALASVTESSLDWHDALCGFSSALDVERFGSSNYQDDRNTWRRGARDLLLLELYKNGLGEADLHGCVNFFSKVVAAEDARCSLTFLPDHAAAGDSVTLRAEQNLLIVLATTPHPLDPALEYRPAAVSVTVSIGEPATADDPSILFRPESARALLETQKVLL